MFIVIQVLFNLIVDTTIFLLYFLYTYITKIFFSNNPIITLTISKTTYSVESRHFDDKCKYIINEGVEGFVCHHPPRKMSNGLHFVVNEQLRSHHNETCKRQSIIQKIHCIFLLKIFKCFKCINTGTLVKENKIILYVYFIMSYILHKWIGQQA